MIPTVDGRNLAPPDMNETLQIMGYSTYQPVRRISEPSTGMTVPNQRHCCSASDNFLALHQPLCIWDLPFVLLRSMLRSRLKIHQGLRFSGIVHPRKLTLYQKWWFWKTYLLSNMAMLGSFLLDFRGVAAQKMQPIWRGKSSPKHLHWLWAPYGLGSQGCGSVYLKGWGKIQKIVQEHADLKYFSTVYMQKSISLQWDWRTSEGLEKDCRNLRRSCLLKLSRFAIVYWPFCS